MRCRSEVFGNGDSLCLLEVSFVSWFKIVEVLSEGSIILVCEYVCVEGGGRMSTISVCSEFCQDG